MKHIKLIIACIAVLAFSACGNTADTSASVDVSNVSDTETASETTAETTAEKITEDTESLTETSEEPAEEEENIDIVPRTIDLGDYKVNISVDNSTWYGTWKEFTDRDKILINSFLDKLDADELQEIISSKAERLNTDIPDTVKASLYDFFFFDCDGDGEEEMLALLDFNNIRNQINPYAVCYSDDLTADFVFSGAHLHRSVFFAAVDSQPFIAEFELAMGYTVDPVVAAKRVFTFSEDGFVPYTVPEGKSLCVRVSEGFNRLYLFNTDPDDNTGYYYMEEIADGEIEQTLAWIDGKLTVTEGFEAE
ncbi:MAG: hypothetical protein K2K34_08995 [Oscillospiraceae bacterium]|nr:hypothetical protein [Oscillospiraceae bacterium]